MKNKLIYFQANSTNQILGLNPLHEIVISKKEDFNNLNEFIKKHESKIILGFINYDIKNSFETLASRNEAFIEFPLAYFFVPKIAVRRNPNGKLTILQGSPNKEELNSIQQFYADLDVKDNNQVELTPTLTKEAYLSNVKKLKKHIQLGDIYEVTFCQDFRSENATVNPRSVFGRLNQLTQAPHTCFVQLDNKYLICGSPERFIQRIDDTLLSQPIKGTSKRFEDSKLDQDSKNQLYNSEKERSENVMIVDLVRNDLSRIAQKDSVKVDELFGIYSFPTVHQMISTISCKIDPSSSFSNIIKALFPMGSMTGAPKIRAMELIEQYEDFQRGLFSGSVGVIYPNGNFDFNVVIRSILYDEKRGRISCPVGSAITISSNPEAEYEECLTKVAAMQRVLFNE